VREEDDFDAEHCHDQMQVLTLLEQQKQVIPHFNQHMVKTELNTLLIANQFPLLDNEVVAPLPKTCQLKKLRSPKAKSTCW
jgi:hypothetical protein